MNKRIPFTTSQKIIEFLTIGVMLFLFGYLLFNWSSIPEKIPLHYNVVGSVDAWSEKSTVLFVPIVCLVLYLLLTVGSFFPSILNIPVERTQRNYPLVIQYSRSMVCYMKLVVVSTFSYMSICTAISRPLGAIFLPVVLIITFGLIVIFFMKIKRCSKITK